MIRLFTSMKNEHKQYISKIILVMGIDKGYAGANFLPDSPCQSNTFFPKSSL